MNLPRTCPLFTECCCQRAQHSTSSQERFQPREQGCLSGHTCASTNTSGCIATIVPLSGEYLQQHHSLIKTYPGSFTPSQSPTAAKQHIASSHHSSSYNDRLNGRRKRRLVGIPAAQAVPDRCGKELQQRDWRCASDAFPASHVGILCV